MKVLPDRTVELGRVLNSGSVTEVARNGEKELSASKMACNYGFPRGSDRWQIPQRPVTAKEITER